MTDTESGPTLQDTLSLLEDDLFRMGMTQKQSFVRKARRRIDELEAEVVESNLGRLSDFGEYQTALEKITELEAHREAGRELAKAWIDGTYEDADILNHLEGEQR